MCELWRSSGWARKAGGYVPRSISLFVLPLTLQLFDQGLISAVISLHCHSTSNIH